MEKVLTGEIGSLLLFAGVFMLAIIAIMSILLPILVFRILTEISDMNKKLNRILNLLSEGARKNRTSPQPSEDRRAGSAVAKKNSPAGIGEKPLRFQ